MYLLNHILFIGILSVSMIGCANKIYIREGVVTRSEARVIKRFVLENESSLLAKEENKNIIFKECNQFSNKEKCDFILLVSARNWGCSTWFDVKRLGNGVFSYSEHELTICK